MSILIPKKRIIQPNQKPDITAVLNTDLLLQTRGNLSYNSDIRIIPRMYVYEADVLIDRIEKYYKVLGDPNVKELAVITEDGQSIATNHAAPNDILELEKGDILVGGSLWVGQDEVSWYAVEPANLVESAPNLFSDIIRGQVIVLPTIANNTISRIDLYLTEFNISGAESIEYELYVELYYADENNKPIGTIGVDYLAQDIILSTDERLQNKDDYYAFDFGTGFTGATNRYAVIYRVNTEANKAGFIWWDVSEYKQETEELQPYLDGASILSKDGGITWEVKELYDRTIKVYYPKPEGYEVSGVTFEELFSESIENPSVALVILIDESGSIKMSE